MNKSTELNRSFDITMRRIVIIFAIVVVEIGLSISPNLEGSSMQVYGDAPVWF